MNPEVKEKWLSALRSGEFTQGKNLLHKFNPEMQEETYCCLGVLCAIAVQDGVIEAPLKRGIAGDGEVPYYVYASSTAFLPTQVQIWAGLDSDNGEFYNEDLNSLSHKDSLIRLNDDGVPFDRIANVIEENF